MSARLSDRLDGVSPERVIGRLTRIVGLEAEARGVRGALGDLVWISSARGPGPAEGVAVRGAPPLGPPRPAALPRPRSSPPAPTPPYSLPWGSSPESVGAPRSSRWADR